MRKSKMGLDFTSPYGSRDTAHAQDKIYHTVIIILLVSQCIPFHRVLVKAISADLYV